MSKRFSPLALTLSVALGGAALASWSCNDNNLSDSTVNVTLREFSVTTEQRAAPEGRVTFHVTNAGTVPHEFLVIRTDLGADRLPMNADGSYQEDGPGTRLINEIDEIDPGTSKDLSVDLDNDSYVLICNMVHDDGTGRVLAHYSLGMRTAFEVR